MQRHAAFLARQLQEINFAIRQYFIGKALSAGFKTQDFQVRFQVLSGKGLHSFKIFSCYFKLFSCYCNS